MWTVFSYSVHYTRKIGLVTLKSAFDGFLQEAHRFNEYSASDAEPESWICLDVDQNAAPGDRDEESTADGDYDADEHDEEENDSDLETTED
ncbi:MAG: hypothetical protein GY847_16540 [Proteobacteria bacterium]|nr:hypothetical protein [Pseudomonadota bacterium]